MRATTILPVFFALALSANASIVTVLFSGNITQVPVDEIFGDIHFGDPFQGTYTFDSTAPDLIPSPSTGSYSFTAPLGITATIGSHIFEAAGSLNIGILNGFIDQYTVLAFSPTGDLAIQLFLQDNSAAVFSGDQLPSHPPSLSAFTQRDFQLTFSLDGSELQAAGQLEVLTAVPEPHSLSLMFAAVLAVYRIRRIVF